MKLALSDAGVLEAGMTLDDCTFYDFGPAFTSSPTRAAAL